MICFVFIDSVSNKIELKKRNISIKKVNKVIKKVNKVVTVFSTKTKKSLSIWELRRNPSFKRVLYRFTILRSLIYSILDQMMSTYRECITVERFYNFHPTVGTLSLYKTHTLSLDTSLFFFVLTHKFILNFR